MCEDPERRSELEAALREVDEAIKVMFKAEVRQRERLKTESFFWLLFCPVSCAAWRAVRTRLAALVDLRCGGLPPRGAKGPCETALRIAKTSHAETIHFTPPQVSMSEINRKNIAQNVEDIQIIGQKRAIPRRRATPQLVFSAPAFVFICPCVLRARATNGRTRRFASPPPPHPGRARRRTRRAAAGRRPRTPSAGGRRGL